MIANVTLIQEPNYLSPVNAEMWYRVNSASASSFTDWKYVFDVYYLNSLTGVTSSKVGRFKVPSRPDTGQGIFTPNKALKSFLSVVGPTNVNPVSNGLLGEQFMYARYTTNFGFEVNPNLEYLDFVNSPSFGIAIPFNYGPQIGDEITINKTNNTINSQYNGVHTVMTFSSGTVSIPGLTGSYYFIGLDGSFGVSTPPLFDGGLITNIFRISGTTSNLLTYNGTRQYNEVTTKFTDIHIVRGTASSALFLTNYDGYKPIKLNEYETHNYMLENISSPLRLTVKLYNSQLQLTNTLQSNLAFSSQFKYFQCPTGTINLSNIFGANTFATASYYDLTLEKSGLALFKPIKFKIDRTCSLYPNVRIIFLNRSGGYSYWTFDRDNKKTVNINRTEYKKVLLPNYTIGERGQTTLSQDVQHTFTLNSNWISEYDYGFLEELITSPDVYIFTDNSQWIPINITDTSYQIKTQLRDKLFNLTINYKLSYSINVANQ